MSIIKRLKPGQSVPDDMITGKDLVKALAPVFISLTLKIVIMRAIGNAARRAAAEKYPDMPQFQK